MKDRAEPIDDDLICWCRELAGQRAAVQAAKLQERVAVIERARGLGVVWVGDGRESQQDVREAVLRLGGDWIPT